MNAGDVPLRIGAERDRRAARALFERASFDEATLCTRLGIASLDDYDSVKFDRAVSLLDEPDLFAACYRIFLGGRAVSRARLDAVMTLAEIEALEQLDLLRPTLETAPDGPGAVYCPVSLAPVGRVASTTRDFLLAADRKNTVDGSGAAPFDDIVFSAHNALTRQFLSLLPTARGADVLDVGTGSGVAALVLAARDGARVVGTDITPRSAHFAAFNAWLNDVPGIEITVGDLYEPVRGRTFDWIVAHPPYVPSLHRSAIFRDGGTTGEDIVRRVVEGAPALLRPRGGLYLLCLGLDTEDGRFEDRVRQWMGPAGREFDIIFALDHFRETRDFAQYLTERTSGAPDDFSALRAVLDERHAKSVVYGALVARKVEGGSGATRRVKLDRKATSGSFSSVLRWLERWRDPDARARLFDARATVTPTVRLEVSHAVRNGEFVPDTFRLTNDGQPFFTEIMTEPWVLGLLTAFDGSHSVREVVEVARSRQRLPPSAGEDTIERMVSFLAERGFIKLEAPES